jgi:multiple sugar transport system substrate-binding protein
MKLAMRALGVSALVAIGLPLSSPAHLTTTSAASSCTGTRIGLNVAGWASANSEADIVRHELDIFAAANPCISVYYHPILGNYQQKIQTEFASGDEPDVFYISPDMIYNEGRAGKLLDLTPYLTKDGVNLNAEIPALLKTFQLGGKTYGLPKDWATLGIFYNKGIFDAKKVPYPTNNMSYDDLRALAQKVYTAGSTPATTTYGILMPEDPGRFNAFLYGFGSSIMDPVTNKIEFNNAQAVAALDYYTSFQLKDKDATIPGTVGDGWQGDSFGKGKTAMVIEGDWLIPYLNTQYPKIKYGVAQMPIGPAGRADPVYTNAWGASIDTVKAGTAAAAAKLVEFLGGVTVQKYQTEIGFSLPTLSSLLNDPYLKTHPESGNLAASYAVGKLGSYGQYNNAANTALANAITEVLLGKMTPAQAIPSAAKTLQSQITAVP